MKFEVKGFNSLGFYKCEIQARNKIAALVKAIPILELLNKKTNLKFRHFVVLQNAETVFTKFIK